MDMIDLKLDVDTSSTFLLDLLHTYVKAVIFFSR